jgi:hypothetical protein
MTSRSSARVIQRRVESSDRSALCRRQILAEALRSLRNQFLFLLVGLFLISATGVSPLHARKEDPGKLGPALQRLVLEFERAGKDEAMKLASRSGLAVKLVQGESLVPVILEAPRPNGSAGIDLARVESLGGRVDAVSRSFVRVLVPVAGLRSLADLPDVARVRTPIRAKELEAGLGTTVSESVALTGADALQEAGIRGAGVKIAIVDLGFIGLADAIAAGELPPGTVALKGNQEGVDIEMGTVHGVGVAEHAMDMAPGAELYCILVDDEVDLENAALYMRDNGISVANHSVGWVNASYYDDTGPITDIINDSRDTDGVFWAVSAGNDAARHWRGGWNDPDSDDRLDFEGTDEKMNLYGSYGTAYIFLNWDQYGNSATDLDLYIYDKDNIIVASSEGAQTGSQEPQEWVGFSYDVENTPYTIQVRRYSGPAEDLDMTIFSFYHNIEYAVAGYAFMEPADAHGAFSIGAIYHGDWNLPDPPPESYSSHGPTNDGRPKPDITAPDGTQSTTYGASYGTSFSSPTTAGAAALMLSVNSSFSPVAIGDTLRAMAEDIGITGPDSVHGWGKLNLAVPIDSLPVIDAIADVPGDQGLAVEIAWLKSFFDYAESPRPVVAYDIFRKAATEGWDSVATVAASGAGLYETVVPTLQDSTVWGGVYYSSFFIRARTAASHGSFQSAPDSGYSVDNMVPPAPSGFAVEYSAPGSTRLTWNRSGEPDIDRYRIYRGIEASFDPDPEDLVHETADTSWVDAVEEGWPYFYRISAVDDAGNEGPDASPETTTDAVSGELPHASVLHQNVPNPFNPTTLIRFELPVRSRARLAVFDVQGRLIRTLVDGELPAGRSEISWNGRDDRGGVVASGVYFYRLETPSAALSRKMVLMR